MSDASPPASTEADPAVPPSGPSARGAALVGAGGAVGGLLRLLVDGLLGEAWGIPLGILVVNLSGALALGVLVAWIDRRGAGRASARRRLAHVHLLLGVGLLGGYTTYSLFALGIADLLLSGQAPAAIVYAAATVGVGALASWTGLMWGSRERGS